MNAILEGAKSFGVLDTLALFPLLDELAPRLCLLFAGYLLFDGQLSYSDPISGVSDLVFGDSIELTLYRSLFDHFNINACSHLLKLFCRLTGNSFGVSIIDNFDFKADI